MICHEINEKIPALIKRELLAHERISAHTHIRQCPACKDEYILYLKMFYTLELEQLNEPEQKMPKHLSEQIIKDQSPENNLHKFFGKRWYALAASLLIISTIFYLYTYKYKDTKSTDLYVAPQNSLTAYLKNENWSELQQVLKNRRELQRRSRENIQISLLIQKLETLQSRGIQTIPFAIVAGAGLEKNTRLMQPAETLLYIKPFIEELHFYQLQSGEISLYQIADILTTS